MFRQLGILTLFSINLIYCDVYRLPKAVKPTRYFLTMEPHLSNGDMFATWLYSGSVIIELDVFENTKNVTLHQKLLNISESSISIADSAGKTVPFKTASLDTYYSTYTMQFEEELSKGGKYNLTIGEFSGELGTAEGFFKAFYWINETAKSLAATHFEPAGARLAFPCFDEPALKAIFVISLIRTDGYYSLANAALDKTEDLGNGRFKDTFKESPKMSTYTVAFAVTDFKSSEKVGPHRIYAKPAAIEAGEWKFSLDIAVKTLKVLEEYTGLEFAIEKMDQIAIPDGYFYEHAMENWGLVVYGESHLMRSNWSQAEDYKRSTCYIAHEFAHQWFGNLVTPAWWDYLWISESFAAYFQFYVASIVQPTWRLMDQFVIDMHHVALKSEERRGAHALNYKIQYSGQYPPFHIMYEKGASILRMVEHFLTHDVFQRGLQIYLENNKFGSTVPSDLYESLQEAVDQANVNYLLHNHTVAEIMGTWDTNAGFPIVTVTRDYDSGSVTIHQESRFKLDGTWMVPINFVSSSKGDMDFSNTHADYWLTEEEVTLHDDFSTEGFLLINKQETGYYRVNYDLENWERIIAFLNTDNYTAIHLVNRAQLIHDAFHLAYKSYLPWIIPLKLGEYIRRETDYVPLAAFYEALTNTIFIYDYSKYGNNNVPNGEFQYFANYTYTNLVHAENPSEYAVFKQYIRMTLGHVNETLGFEALDGDTHLDKLLRTKFEKLYKYFYDD